MTLTAPAPRTALPATGAYRPTWHRSTRSAAPAGSSEAVLADDAQPRPVLDLALPVSALVAPLVADLRSRRTAAEVVAAAASTGLLDVGVDTTLGHVNGYAPAAPPADLRPAWQLLSCADAAAAVTVVAQRRSIDVLALGHRTAANDRLLRALRRGWVVGSLPLGDQPMVEGQLGVDGSVVVAHAELTVTAAGPGAALLLPVSLGGGRVVIAWVGLGLPGATVTAGRQDGSAVVRLDEVAFPSDVIVLEAADDREAQLAIWEPEAVSAA